HRVVLMEVGLLDATILHSTLAVEQGGEAVDERARHLAIDLCRIDRVTRIGGADDALDLDLVSIRDRDLRRGGDVAAVAHLLGEAAIDALRCGLVPADLLRHCIEYGEMLGMLAMRQANKRIPESAGSSLACEHGGDFHPE